MADGETVLNGEVLTDRERALIEQNEAMRQELYKVALIAQGFVQDAKTYSRRQIYEDLRLANNRHFSPGYRPTNAEIFNKVLGPDNWVLLPSGEVDDRPDPTGQETPEITEWQNTKYHLFSRNLDEQRIHGTKPAHEIMQEVDNRFPNLNPVQHQSEENAEMQAAIEDAAVRPQPEPKRPEEPEAERQTRHVAIEGAAVREQPEQLGRPEESEAERQARHTAIEDAAVRPHTQEVPLALREDNERSARFREATDRRFGGGQPTQQ